MTPQPPVKEEGTDDSPLRDGLQQCTPPNPDSARLSTPADQLISNGTRRSYSARRRAGPESALNDLEALPEVRSIPWIPGKELPPDRSTESPRTQTRGAFLLSTRGTIRHPPCTHCANGAGRFSACISLDPWFFGACSTCQMATRGHLCSLRTEKEEREGTPSAVRPRKLTPALQPTPQAVIPSLSNIPHPHNHLKRKLDGIETPSYNQPPRPVNTPPTTFYGASFHNNPSVPLGHRFVPPNASYQTIYRTPDTTTEIRMPPNAAPIPYNNPGNEHLERVGTAIVRMEQPPSTQSGIDSTMVQKEVPREILSPTPPPTNGHKQLQRPTGEQLPTEIASIDNLPKKKQKQIFGIIGGIQSGLRSVRQQADQLQKQLDLLQSALGIDIEDDASG